MSTRPIRFFHRGAIVEVRDAAPTRSVLDWLREDAQCTGTKEGCNEGDCGACTVVVAEPAAMGEPGAVRGLRLRTVNACIRFLPTLDGKALFTVEDLKGLEPGTLHPAQQALVDCHGSQCGFCTPGFVMSLWSACERHQAAGNVPSRQQLADTLAGNLCRCTGYRPILDAGQRMFEAPAAPLDTAPVLAALHALQRDPPLCYQARSRPTEAPDATPSPVFHAPTTVADLAALRLADPGATLLAGATDIGLWVNKQFRPLGDLHYVGQVTELAAIAEHRRADGRVLHIGAAASLEAAWQALAQHVPALTEVWLRFAAPPVRHAGTLGGNVANGSPIGDAAPVLMALGAQLELRCGERRRRLPLDEFYTGYMKNRLEPGEFIETLLVPLDGLSTRIAGPVSGGAASWQVRAYKVSKRFDCDISALCAGLALRLVGGRVADVRLAFGGMAATVARARGAEAALRGQPWDEEHLAAAQAALGTDFQPLTDLRASAGYRTQVAANLLRRFWLETRPVAPLAADQVNVFAALSRGAMTPATQATHPGAGA